MKGVLDALDPTPGGVTWLFWGWLRLAASLHAQPVPLWVVDSCNCLSKHLLALLLPATHSGTMPACASAGVLPRCMSPLAWPRLPLPLMQNCTLRQLVTCSFCIRHGT